jgi:DNA-binding YbaB/EbfC family protein
MNIQKMMKQAQEMQNKMTALQAKIEQEETDGAAGGGMVKLRINGKGSLLKIDLDPSLLKPEEKEMLEDLIIAAFADAKKKSDESAAGQMGQVTAGLNLPPGMKLPF